MLCARFVDPDAGFERDQECCKRAGLVVGCLYHVSHINMGQSFTDIYLEECGKLAFNSVHFEFEEDGKPINIYRDSRYNPYM